LSCSILFSQDWRSFAGRNLRGGERLFVLNISGGYALGQNVPK